MEGVIRGSYLIESKKPVGSANDVREDDESTKGDAFIVGRGWKLPLHAAVGAYEKSDMGDPKIGQVWCCEMLYTVINQIE